MYPCSTCSGTNGLSSISIPNIGLEVLSESIGRLSEGDVLALLASLPEETMTKICKSGVKDKVTGYLPWAAGAAVAAFVLFKVIK